MIFSYTFRSVSGAVQSDMLEADSRSAVFAELKRRGVVPLSVRADKNSRTDQSVSVTTCSKTTKFPFFRCAQVGLGVAVLLIGTFWWWIGGPSTDSYPSHDTKSAEEPVSIEGDYAIATHRSLQITPKNESIETAKIITRTHTTTQESGDQRQSIGTTVDSPQVVSLPISVFKNPSDQLIAIAISAGEGGIPPMPISSDMEKEFIRSLDNEIIVLETDDAQTRKIKEAVRETRAEIKQLMDQGKTFSQIMYEHQNLINENAAIRTEATLELKKLLEAGDIEGARLYKQKMNLALRQMGIKELSVPVTDEEREERASIRRAKLKKRNADQNVTKE